MLTAAPGVHYAITPEGAAVLDTTAGRWLMLDPAAATVWREAVTIGSVAGLADRIAIPAGLDPATVRAAVDDCVASLLERGVLADTGRPPAPSRRWWKR
ncbi:PqqD family protein [Streptomyces sp. DH12]|uniref:PqqD family protein n=1 Tax=Streptomyces sp. DH12 TaxID=2857010 RepID=UPI001E613260|nr:PqqD family protein [Streptomyces sp. DH12]